MKRSKKVALLLSLISFFMLVALFNSCVNDSKKSEPTPAAAQLSGDLYYLRLTKAQYEYLTTDAQVKKFMFHFYFRNDSTNYPTLVGYGTKKKEYERVTDSVVLTTNGVVGLTLPPVKFLSTQEILRSKIDDKLAAIFGSPNPATWNYDHLVFKPEINAQGHIFYSIKVICSPACPNPAADLFTNPSPPKNGE
jgi:hypothetical protein